MTTIENKAIRAGSLCKLIEQREVMNDIMDGYGRLLQKRNTTRHCKVLSSNFFENLYTPTGKAKQSPRETLNLKKAAAYTTEINIFEYQLILIPVLVKEHWTLIAVDVNT